MTLPRLLLVWFVGLFVALSFSLTSKDMAMAGAPAEIRVAIDEQGLLHLTPAVDNQGAAFSLQRDKSTGQVIITGPSGRVSLPQPLREGQDRFVLNTAQGQLEIVLPEQGQPLELALAYAAGEGRLLLKAGPNLELVGAELARSLILQVENRLTLGPGAFTVAGDLSLLAGQTLYIRDEKSHPLLAQVEGQFILQSHQAIDIFALSHPASALRSGGDMVLRSPRPVRGDAHYLAGGQFRIEQLDGRAGSLVSPYDPIILANQNVSLGSYTGASLHILAGGSVTLNNVTITGNDTAANTINPANATLFNGATPIGSLASFNLSDGTPVTINGSAQPTLDVRAGIAWGTFAGGTPANQVIPPGLAPTFSGPATNADITVGTITLSPPNGLVLLTNQYRPNGLSGNITTGAINTGTASPGGNGGAILIDSRDNITTGSLNTTANVAGSAASSGGEVRVLAEGDISLGGVSTFARSLATTAGNGGDVTLRAGGALNNISINSYVESVTGSGNAGDINIKVAGPLALTNLLSFSRFSGAGFSGNAGDVTILVKNAGPLDGSDELHLNYLWSDSGAWYFGSAVGPSGNGANVSLETEDGDVIFDNWIWVQTLARGGTNDSGNGGDIAVTATNGGITTGNFGLNTRTEVASGSSGNTGRSGDVTLIAEEDINVNLAQNNGGILADSRALSGATQGSGTILIQSSSGAIDFGNNGIAVLSFSNGGQAGSTGGITLEAVGNINARSLDASSQSINGGSQAGSAGPVLVTAGGNINLTNGINSLADASTGAAGNGGNITVQAGGLFTSANINSYVRSATGAGNGGDINISASGPLTLANLQSYTRFSGTGSSGDAGDISILVKNTGPLDGGDDLHLNFIAADSGAWYSPDAVGPSGNGANVSLETEDGDVIFDNWIWVQTLARGGANNAGDGGDITITAANGGITTGNFGLHTRTEVASNGSGNTGQSGDVTLIAEGDINVNPAQNSGGLQADSRTLAGIAQGSGTVLIQSSSGSIDFGNNTISVQTFSDGGQAGSTGGITLEAVGNINIRLLEAQSRAINGGSQAGSAGPVLATAGGNINLPNGINSYADAPAGTAGNGGDVTVTAGGLFISTNINTYVQSATGSGNAGDISITAAGPLTLANLQSYARFSGAGSSGDSGEVSILVKNAGPLDGGDDMHLNYIWSDSGAWYFGSAVGPSGDGANVSLETEDGDVIFNEWIWVQTLARGGTNSSGDGGDVVITATNGSFSVGNFGINTQSQVASSGNAGKGGDVTITAAGTITNPTFGGIESRSVALAGNSAGGGTILLHATGGSINFGSNDLNTLSETSSGQAGSGGSITLEAAGAITAGDLRAYSRSVSGKAGSAGPVELLADSNIQVVSISATALGGAGHGAGGKVNVETNQFFQVTGLLPTSIANQGLANSSAITITHGGGGVTPFIVGNGATNGTAGAITTGDALLSPTQPYLYTHFEAPNLWIISVPSPLAIDKLVTPTTDAPYQGAVTYTITLSNNSGTVANGMLLTDTLPAPVDFDHWLQQPAGAAVAADQLTWNGTVPANGQVTFSFVASHTGVYSQVVTNTASFFHPASGGEDSDQATFVVEPDPWLISGPAPLAINKLVTTGAGVPYHGAVTYTITLSNSSGVPANGMLLTDTLPGPVNFHHWLQKPTGAGIAANKLTWNGTVPANGQVTFSFVVSHTGVYSQVVTNTASFFHPASGGQKSDGATFVVEPDPGSLPPPQNKIYIPMLLK